MVGAERPWALRGVVALRIAAGLVPAALALSVSALIDAATDLVGTSASLTESGVLAWLLVVALVGVFASLQATVQAVIERDIGRTTSLRVRSDLMTFVNALPDLALLEAPEVHDRILISQSQEHAQSQVVKQVLAIGEQTIAVVSVIMVLSSISPWAAAAASLAVVPTLAAELYLSKRRAEMLAENAQTMRRRSFYSDLVTDLRAAKEIRVYGFGDTLADRMRSEYRSINSREREMDMRSLRVAIGLGVVTSAFTVVALVLGMRDILGPAGSIGGVAILLAAVTNVQNSSRTVVGDAGLLTDMINVVGHYDVVRELAQRDDDPQTATTPDRRAAERPANAEGRASSTAATPPGRAADPLAKANGTDRHLGVRSRRAPAPDADPAALHRPPTAPGVELDRIWFRYSPAQPWVLRGLNLKVPAGATVAIVGPNGAGKSTILKLICQLYRAERGTITYDVDGASTTARPPIATLFQDYMEYELTAADNIGLGDVRRLGDRPGIRRAAGRADLLAELDGLPAGLDTVLSRIFVLDRSNEGTILSGGQWQRLALARAYFADAGLLLLDEPTSSLDADAEERLATALAEAGAARTTVVVSHRFSTARMADSIFVVEHGAVTEQGSHDALLELGGTYTRMYTKQRRAFASASGIGVPG